MAERKKDKLMSYECYFMIHSYKYLLSFFIIDTEDLFFEEMKFNV